MAGLSDFAENELLDHFLGVGAWTKPAAVYAALHTADPTDAGTGTEVSGNGYARQAITFGAAASGLASNSSEENFVASGGNFGTISHVGIRDAITVGNLLIHGAWNPSRIVNDGDTFKIAIGALSIRFPNGGAAKLTDYARNKLLDHVLGTTTFTMPATPRIGLFTAEPGVGGGGTEVSGNGYARQTVAFSAASGGASANTGLLTFTAAGGNWGTLTHWGYFDATSGGNLLAWGPLPAARVVNNGDSLPIPIGEIDMSFA